MLPCSTPSTTACRPSPESLEDSSRTTWVTTASCTSPLASHWCCTSLASPLASWVSGSSVAPASSSPSTTRSSCVWSSGSSRAALPSPPLSFCPSSPCSSPYWRCHWVTWTITAVRNGPSDPPLFLLFSQWRSSDGSTPSSSRRTRRANPRCDHSVVVVSCTI